MQETMPGARRRGRPRTAWMDNIKKWIGLHVEESIGMREDTVGESTSMVWPTVGSRTTKKQKVSCTFYSILAGAQPRLQSWGPTPWSRVILPFYRKK